MKVVGLKDITRKDVPIYYRRLFHAVAELELLNKTIERRIEFKIETMPTGLKETTVNLVDSVDYPLVPVIQSLRAFVADLDERGALP